ncbi:MAG: hypothetical protein NXI10_09880 [bacterium]|nr:hypothetical protein [bacterium]
MSNKVTDFPQYRKLSNEKVFYRIRDDRNFDEIQLVGSRAMFFSMEAKQYPEILKIKDLLEIAEGFLSSNQHEFDTLLEQHGLG